MSATSQNTFFQILLSTLLLFGIFNADAQHDLGVIAVVPVKNDQLNIFDYYSFYNLTMKIPGKRFSMVDHSTISIENDFFLEIEHKGNLVYEKGYRRALKSIKKEAKKLVGKEKENLISEEDLGKDCLVWAYVVQYKHDKLGEVNQYTMVYNFWYDMILVNIILKDPLPGGWDHPIITTSLESLQIHKKASEPTAYAYGQKIHELEAAPIFPYSTSTKEMQLLRIDSFGYIWHFDQQSTKPLCYIHEYSTSNKLGEENLVELLKDWHNEVFRIRDVSVETTTNKILQLRSPNPKIDEGLNATNYYFLRKCGDLMVGLYLSCGPCSCDDALLFFKEFTENYICPEAEMTLK